MKWPCEAAHLAHCPAPSRGTGVHRSFPSLEKLSSPVQSFVMCEGHIQPSTKLALSPFHWGFFFLLSKVKHRWYTVMLVSGVQPRHPASMRMMKCSPGWAGVPVCHPPMLPRYHWLCSLRWTSLPMTNSFHHWKFVPLYAPSYFTHPATPPVWQPPVCSLCESVSQVLWSVRFRACASRRTKSAAPWIAPSRLIWRSDSETAVAFWGLPAVRAMLYPEFAKVVVSSGNSDSSALSWKVAMFVV